ncbi:hypothetical protein O3G_MSEX002720 [Manduca sexta]|uniref:Uncharacterized protein n=1 Tax=Manduca sexta TaxID=7130 RepID=A0A921YPU6_MANSE|nr:hypothetical protein O3G_MSEX002720 [Manduca sexta]
MNQKEPIFSSTMKKQLPPAIIGVLERLEILSRLSISADSARVQQVCLVASLKSHGARKNSAKSGNLLAGPMTARCGRASVRGRRGPLPRARPTAGLQPASRPLADKRYC